MDKLKKKYILFSAQYLKIMPIALVAQDQPKKKGGKICLSTVIQKAEIPLAPPCTRRLIYGFLFGIPSFGGEDRHGAFEVGQACFLHV